VQIVEGEGVRFDPKHDVTPEMIHENLSRIVGVDAEQPEYIKVGTPLKVEFLEKREGPDRKIILAFKPY